MDIHSVFQDDTSSPPLRLVQDDMLAPRSETLPIEIIEEIIDRASDHSESLRALSLLCKSLLTRVRFHLFTGIVIRNMEQMNTSREFLDAHPWVLPLRSEGHALEHEQS